MAMMVTTKVAAQEIGVSGSMLKKLAFQTPDFPRPITLLSTHPTKRQFRWNLAALREFFARENALTHFPEAKAKAKVATKAQVKAATKAKPKK